MPNTVVALALASALLGGWVLPASAQSNGLVIQNNGVDSTNSAAGADNVRISRAPGKSSSNNGGGAGNQEKRAVREPKDRKDRGNRNNGGGAAPADETAAVRSQSNPARVPSRSIDVSRISPAPRACASTAHSTASRPVAAWPLRANTSNLAPSAFASIATTTA